MSTMTENLVYTPLDEISSIHDRFKKNFNTGKARPVEYRKKQLSQLLLMLRENGAKFEDALAKDLGRPKLESNLMELDLCKHDAAFALANVDKWVKENKPAFNMMWFAVKPRVRKEPKGVVLIISPFNFPAWLCLGPLSGAIAAGNAVVVKPAESAPAMSTLLAELFPKYLDPEMYTIVNGGIPETTKLLELQWDHIMFTGSGRVGKVVAAAAAKHLTPTTLELGGKSPVIIDPKTNLEKAARRIAWGKFANAGQACVSPDYILIPAEAQDKFVAAVKKAYNEFYPEGPENSKSFSRMINDVAWARVDNLLKTTKGTIVLGGKTDRSQKYIAPTVVKDVRTDDSLMNEELFGPIMPIVPVSSFDEALAFIKSRDHPLALYVYSDDAKLKQKIADNTLSGSIVYNECMIQLTVPDLPFGGVGASGYGSHGGVAGFNTFTHFRSTIDAPSWLELAVKARYAPYTESNLKRLKAVGEMSLPKTSGSSFRRWIIALAGIMLAVGAASKARTLKLA